MMEATASDESHRNPNNGGGGDEDWDWGVFSKSPTPSAATENKQPTADAHVSLPTPEPSATEIAFRVDDWDAFGVFSSSSASTIAASTPQESEVVTVDDTPQARIIPVIAEQEDATKEIAFRVDDWDAFSAFSSRPASTTAAFMPQPGEVVTVDDTPHVSSIPDTADAEQEDATTPDLLETDIREDEAERTGSDGNDDLVSFSAFESPEGARQDTNTSEHHEENDEQTNAFSVPSSSTEEQNSDGDADADASFSSASTTTASTPQPSDEVAVDDTPHARIIPDIASNTEQEDATTEIAFRDNDWDAFSAFSSRPASTTAAVTPQESEVVTVDDTPHVSSIPDTADAEQEDATTPDLLETDIREGAAERTGSDGNDDLVSFSAFESPEGARQDTNTSEHHEDTAISENDEQTRALSILSASTEEQNAGDDADASSRPASTTTASTPQPSEEVTVDDTPHASIIPDTASTEQEGEATEIAFRDNDWDAFSAFSSRPASTTTASTPQPGEVVKVDDTSSTEGQNADADATAADAAAADDDWANDDDWASFQSAPTTSTTVSEPQPSAETPTIAQITHTTASTAPSPAPAASADINSIPYLFFSASDEDFQAAATQLVNNAFPLPAFDSRESSSWSIPEPPLLSDLISQNPSVRALFQSQPAESVSPLPQWKGSLSEKHFLEALRLPANAFDSSVPICELPPLPPEILAKIQRRPSTSQPDKVGQKKPTVAADHAGVLKQSASTRGGAQTQQQQVPKGEVKPPPTSSEAKTTPISSPQPAARSVNGQQKDKPKSSPATDRATAPVPTASAKTQQPAYLPKLAPDSSAAAKPRILQPLQPLQLQPLQPLQPMQPPSPQPLQPASVQEVTPSGADSNAADSDLFSNAEDIPDEEFAEFSSFQAATPQPSPASSSPMPTDLQPIVPAELDLSFLPAFLTAPSSSAAKTSPLASEDDTFSAFLGSTSSPSFKSEEPAKQAEETPASPQHEAQPEAAALEPAVEQGVTLSPNLASIPNITFNVRRKTKEKADVPPALPTPSIPVVAPPLAKPKQALAKSEGAISKKAPSAAAASKPDVPQSAGAASAPSSFPDFAAFPPFDPPLSASTPGILPSAHRSSPSIPESNTAPLDISFLSAMVPSAPSTALLPMPSFFEDTPEPSSSSTPAKEEENKVPDDEQQEGQGTSAKREKRHRIDSYYQRRMSQALMAEAAAASEESAVVTDTTSEIAINLNTSSSGRKLSRKGSKSDSRPEEPLASPRSRETTPKSARRASREQVRQSSSASPKARRSLDNGSGKAAGSSPDSQFLERWLGQLPDLTFMLSSTLVFPPPPSLGSSSSTSSSSALPPQPPLSSLSSSRSALPFDLGF